MEYIYFVTYDGDLIDNHDIARMARIIEGKKINFNDFDKIREFAKFYKGIEKEIKEPSLKWLVANGHKMKAARIRYRQYPEEGIEAAIKFVDNL